MHQWLDKPQKKFEHKTAREVILEERASLGNPEKKVSYSFFSFSYSLILYYKSGPLAVAEEIRLFIKRGLIKEALKSIREKFRSREAEGPS